MEAQSRQGSIGTTGLIAACLATLLATGCAAAPWSTPAQMPVAFGSDNPCAALSPTHHYNPRYPHAAVADEQQGWVALKYHVAANGEVFNVRVVAASTPGVFDDTSIAALSHARYPAMNYPLRNCSQIDVYSLSGEFASLR